MKGTSGKKEIRPAKPAMEPLPSREAIDAVCCQRFSGQVYEKLRQARVAIAGLGGLGSNIAVMLTRSGIGRLKLVDFDRVELSNLNRQAYQIRHLGMKKTEALPLLLREINPYAELEPCDARVTEENAADIFRGWPWICEAFDNPEAKAMLAGQILRGSGQQAGGSWQPVLVSGSGMAGYGDANAIRTRKVNSRFYICGDEQTEPAEGAGLMAPRVAVCAGHQANKIIQLILNADSGR